METHVVLRGDGWVQVYETATEGDSTTNESSGKNETGADSRSEGGAASSEDGPASGSSGDDGATER